MSRVCELTGVRVQSGNNISHSHRVTRRRFLPNLHKVHLLSEALKLKFTFRITASTLRTIDSKGGLDSFILSAKKDNFSEKAMDLRRKLEKKFALTNEEA